MKLSVAKLEKVSRDAIARLQVQPEPARAMCPEPALCMSLRDSQHTVEHDH